MNEPPTRPLRKESGIQQFLRWFKPGLGVKRWLVLIMLGVTMLGLGLALLLLDIYRTDSTNPLIISLLSYASLRFLPRFARVLIFGGLGVGDPACDLMIAWGLFSGESRDVFRAALSVDDATWARGCGWALSQALIFIPYYLDTNPVGVGIARHTIDEVLAEYCANG